MERRRYLLRGRVQGVGFRANTASIARRFDVTGNVRNLSNGTVEIIAQGESAEIERFLAEVEDRFSGYVTSLEHTAEPVRPDETAFTVIR